MQNSHLKCCAQAGFFLERPTNVPLFSVCLLEPTMFCFCQGQRLLDVWQLQSWQFPDIVASKCAYRYKITEAHNLYSYTSQSERSADSFKQMHSLFGWVAVKEESRVMVLTNLENSEFSNKVWKASQVILGKRCNSWKNVLSDNTWLSEPHLKGLVILICYALSGPIRWLLDPGAQTHGALTCLLLFKDEPPTYCLIHIWSSCMWTLTFRRCWNPVQPILCLSTPSTLLAPSPPLQWEYILAPPSLLVRLRTVRLHSHYSSSKSTHIIKSGWIPHIWGYSDSRRIQNPPGYCAGHEVLLRQYCERKLICIVFPVRAETAPV